MHEMKMARVIGALATMAALLIAVRFTLTADEAAVYLRMIGM